VPLRVIRTTVVAISTPLWVTTSEVSKVDKRKISLALFDQWYLVVIHREFDSEGNFFENFTYNIPVITIVAWVLLIIGSIGLIWSFL